MKITPNKPSQPCLAPWIALAVKPNGDVGPDAQFEGAYGNILEQSLDEILSSEKFQLVQQSFIDRKFSPGCQNCQKKESTLGHSRRIFFEHTQRRFFPDIDQTQFQKPQITYLDLNLSNKCNLKCRMCNSVSSTSWLQEDRELFKKFGPQLNRPHLPRAAKIDLSNVLKLFQSRDHFKNLRYVALRGGEPLLEIENIKVLEQFIEWGLASQITLDISTNGTVISNKILSLMSQFQQVDFYISVDAAGELYRYIRGGETFSIHDLEKNIVEFRKVPNLTIMFTVAVSIYNIFRLDELWDWFDQIYKPFDEITFSNAVVRPSYLNFQILPPELKIQALHRLEASRILEGPHHSGRRLLGDSGKQLIRESLKKEVFTVQQKTILTQKFCDFTTEVDRMRGTNILDHLPELAPLFSAKQKDQNLPHL